MRARAAGESTSLIESYCMEAAIADASVARYAGLRYSQGSRTRLGLIAVARWRGLAYSVLRPRARCWLALFTGLADLG